MQSAHAFENDQDGGDMSATLRKENGHGWEIVPPIPKPEENLEGKLFDPQGNTVAPAKPTLMARIDAKGSEDVTLKKSTIWLLGAGVIVLQLAFNYGGSMLAWARDDESQKGQIMQIQSDIQGMKESMKDMQSDFKDIQKNLQADSLQKAKIDGFNAGVAEAQSDKGNK